MENYAGFWIRVGAYFIDVIILIIGNFAIYALFGLSFIDSTQDPSYGLADLLSFIAGLAYFVGFNSSAMQGTPGKRALGLIVTDAQGNRISVLRALGRYFAKILSGIILLIGYIMVAFTERKQGLHDMIAGTLVLRANPGEVGIDPGVFQ